MKKSLFIPIAGLTLAAMACGPFSVTVNVPKLTTGPTQTLTVNEPKPDTNSAVDVGLAMGAGELILTGGGLGLIEGEIKYNVLDWAPTIASDATSIQLEQGETDFNGFPGNDVVNDWNLKLGDAPMNLTIEAGAYHGELDLSGVPLQNLSIHDGASESTVRFDTLNPEEMERFDYDSGASSVELIGLANANFEKMEFSGGAGEYTLDFSGDLQRDATVVVNGGVGSFTIIVPATTAVKLTVDTGIGSVDTDGVWTISGDTYATGGTGPVLTIKIKMGVGSLELVSK